jgi:lysophospholipase L1-like esterase
MKRVGELLAVILLVAACGPASSATVAATVAAAATAATGTAAHTDAAPSTTGNHSTPALPTTLPTQMTAQAAYAAAKLRAGPLTIATLGDSLTEGQGDDTGVGYPGRLKALLDAIRPGTNMINVGHSGWSSTDLINGQNGEPSEITRAIAAKPTVALVWIGSNDLWYLYEFGPDPMTTEAEQEDRVTYEANIEKILSELTSQGVAVYIALLDDQSKRPVAANPPNPTEPAFPATTAADLARMSVHVRAYNDIIRSEAARYHATTVDFNATTIFTDAATLYSDGNHPNGAGYDKIAEIWFAALKPALS